MSLRHIILGMLDEPASGYDLKQRLDKGLQYFWGAESSQVYATLKGMEKDGLVRSTKEKSDKGPERRVYARSAAGESELNDWLEKEPELGQARLGLLAQMYFLGRSTDSKLSSEFLRNVRRRFAERLATYEELIDADQAPAEKMVLDMELRALRARLEWCDETIAQMLAAERSR